MGGDLILDQQTIAIRDFEIVTNDLDVHGGDKMITSKGYH